jgi:hypothetical protein
VRRKPNKAFASKEGSKMKPKFTLIAVLALGVLVCGTTASPVFAASAGSAQYAPEEEEQHFCEESGEVETENGCEPPYEEEQEHVCEEGESSSGGSESGSGSSVGENCEHPAPPQPPTHLPYTGFPVAPALLVGVGLLGAGLMMRRRLGSGGGFA